MASPSSAPKKRPKGSQTESGSSSLCEPFDVFISHAGEDKATIAIPLRERLHEKGFSAFVDEVDMSPGTDAKRAMSRAMETAKIGVIVLSPEFVVRKWPMRELMCFLRRREEHLSKKGDDEVTIPMIIPFFYRLSIKELYDEPKLDRTDEDGLLVHKKSEFYERQGRGEQEANISEIKTALGKLHGIMGVRNTVAATNGSSYDMNEKREWLLHKICREICKVKNGMVKMERSRDNEQGLEIYARRARESCVWNREEEGVDEAKDAGRDGEKSEILRNRANEGLDSNSIYNLALKLEREAEGFQSDAVEAEKLYRRAIDVGHIHAMNNLAVMLKNGANGVARDAVEAEKLFRRAIEDRHVMAMHNLAMMLRNGAEGVKRDMTEAKKLLRRAIDAGNVTSMYSLAVMLSNKKDMQQDAVEAVKLYRRANEGGNVKAMYNLALMLEKRTKGVKRNAVEAKKLYLLAVEAGHVKSMNNLAVMLEKGAKGVERNAVEAEKLYRRAIDAGHITSMKNLGVMLHKGVRGVDRDATKSDKLLKQYLRRKHAQGKE